MKEPTIGKLIVFECDKFYFECCKFNLIFFECCKFFFESCKFNLIFFECCKFFFESCKFFLKVANFSLECSEQNFFQIKERISPQPCIQIQIRDMQSMQELEYHEKMFQIPQPDQWPAKKRQNTYNIINGPKTP